MADAKGIITALDGEYALVQMEDSGCGRCHEPGGCGGVNIGKMLCINPQVFRVLNAGQSAVGQRVSVTIPDGAVRNSALLAYGLPLLLFLLGAFVGFGAAGDLGAVVGSVSGLVVSLPILRSVQLRHAASRQFQPYIDSGASGK
ncbi:MAG: SoxR reducing system RseC family protein [Propionivibrio sp.]